MAALALNLAQTGGNLIMGLLAAHDKRVAAAKAENSAVNAAVSAMVHDIHVIADGFSNGTIAPGGAVQACVDVDAWYWQYINPFTQYKNASPAQCNPNQFGDNAKLAKIGTRCWQSTQSGTHFTAASDIGCNIIDANLGMLRAAIISLNGKAPGTSTQVNVCGTPSNKYGLTQTPSFNVTLTVPSKVTPEEVTLSASGVLSVGTAPDKNTVAIVQGTSSSPLSGVFGSFGGSSNLLLYVLFGVVLLLVVGGRK
jgi:hypothetical protein